MLVQHLSSTMVVECPKAIKPTLKGRISLIAKPMPNPLITVKVGPTHEPFILHRHVLANASSHFRSLLHPAYPTEEPSTIELSKTTPRVFRIVMDFLYYSRLPVFYWGDDDAPLDEKRWDNWNDLMITLAIFAHKYSLPTLSDALFDLYFSTHVEHAQEERYLLPDDETLSRACESLPKNSPIVQFLVDLCAQLVGDDVEAVEEGLVEASESFVKLVVLAKRRLLRNGGEQLKVRFDACSYHEHGAVEQRCRRASVEEWTICG